MNDSQLTEGSKRNNPFKTAWNTLSSIGGAVGLVSFVDNWYDWPEFYCKLLDFYRLIVYWPFDWFPFSIPDQFKDYLFLGGLVMTASFKSIGLKYRTGKPIKDFLQIAGGCLMFWLFWPLPLGHYLRSYFFDDQELIETASQIFQRLGAILIVFFGFLLFSIILNGGF